MESTPKLGAYDGLNRVTSIVSSLGNLVQISDDDRNMIQQMSALKNMKEQADAGVCQVVFYPDGNENISLVAQLEKEFLLEPIEKINKQCYVLCKVQRKIKKDEEVEVDAILEGMDVFKPFLKGGADVTLSNPQEIKDVIKAPGLFVLPVAIYQ